MESQYTHVKKVLEKSRRPLAIHEIGACIKARFRVQHADTAISARIREIRRDLATEGRTVLSRRAGPGKAHHVYAIGQLAGS